MAINIETDVSLHSVVSMLRFYEMQTFLFSCPKIFSLFHFLPFRMESVRKLARASFAITDQESGNLLTKGESCLCQIVFFNFTLVAGPMGRANKYSINFMVSDSHSNQMFLFFINN